MGVSKVVDVGEVVKTTDLETEREKSKGLSTLSLTYKYTNENFIILSIIFYSYSMS